MHTTILILAGYIGFTWAVAAVWVGWSVLQTSRESAR
jgi:hypothetical protein